MLKQSILWVYRRAIAVSVGCLDHTYLHSDVPMSKVATHSSNLEYLAKEFNRPGTRILEVGSREVTGKSKARAAFSEAEYVGFDYYPGPNVDVVGDAHKISSLVSGQFDLIYSSAVFEHLAMPWIVAMEIAKLLKVGGTLFVETHFSCASHERPWHFFQFSDMALRALFPPAMGFECIEAGMSNPMVGRFSGLADKYLRYRRITGLYCHVEYLGRKIKDVPDFRWEDMDLGSIAGETMYPAPPAAR
jgi:hypothetical protein